MSVLRLELVSGLVGERARAGALLGGQRRLSPEKGVPCEEEYF